MKSSRRGILAASAAGGAMLALGGCEKLISKVADHLGQDIPDSLDPPRHAEIDHIHHLLNRAGFGPWPGDVERVRAMGADRWIDWQLQPESIDDTLCDLRSRRAEFEGNAGECYEYRKPVLREAMARHTLLQALYSRRQLFETMVGFWTDHLNVNIDKGDCIYLKPWDDQHVIRKHALGNFRELIRASATSPAMLVYLDGNHNKGGKPTDIPNENYGRELIELHTLGVHGGYAQHDVYEAARALTGWRVRHGFMKGSVHFVPSEHDQGAKTLLGHRIAAGGNEKDIDAVVDIVCRHPATATHIAGKLVARFVSDVDPPPALIERTAEVFRSTDGDIKSVVRTVLTSEEFRASRGVKFKPPFRFVVSALRALGADTHAHTPVIEYLSRMGQGVFQYPTPDGYPDKASPWLGTLLWRWNFAMALAAGQAPQIAVHLDKLSAALHATPADAAARLFEHLLGRAPSEAEASALADAADAKLPPSQNVSQLAGLILASPGFQRF